MSPQPPPDTTWLYLVRHGATEANERKPYILQGRGVNYGLSAAGREQAEAVGRFLADFPLQAVYASCLLRSIETAEAIARGHGLEIRRVDELAECHVGQWEGKDWDTIRRDFPDDWRAFDADPGSARYPGGESYGDVLERVRPVFDRVLQEHRGQSVAVVAHSIVNRAWLGHLLGLDGRRSKDLRQANGCVNLVHAREGHAQVMTLNAHFHVPGALH